MRLSSCIFVVDPQVFAHPAQDPARVGGSLAGGKRHLHDAARLQNLNTLDVLPLEHGERLFPGHDDARQGRKAGAQSDDFGGSDCFHRYNVAHAARFSTENFNRTGVA